MIKTASKINNLTLSKVGEGGGGGKGDFYSKFYSKLLLVNIRKCFHSNFIKIRPQLINTFLKRGGGAGGEGTPN